MAKETMDRATKDNVTVFHDGEGGITIRDEELDYWVNLTRKQCGALHEVLSAIGFDQKEREITNNNDILAREMTLRDHFAVEALALGLGQSWSGSHLIEISKRSYEVADAMLEARSINDG